MRKQIQTILYKMGSCATGQTIRQKKRHQFVVGTLNYGGILNSPFQFYSNQQEEQQVISKHFKSLIPQYFPDFDEKTFSWKIGKIDQKIQQQRYTPIYNTTAGIQNGKLISAQRFIQLWNQYFQEALTKAKLQKAPTQEQKNYMRTFDLICYHALLKHAYKIQKIKEVQGKDPSNYTELLNRYFSRSYLDEDKKLEKLAKLLQDGEFCLDVLFIQQPTQKLVSFIEKRKEQYVLQKGQKDKTLIIIKNGRKYFKRICSLQQFNDEMKLFQPEQIKKIQANKETRIVICDKIIFINLHLSSKAQKNKVQLAQARQGIAILKSKMPDYDFVIGGDTNTFVKQSDIWQQKSQKPLKIVPQTAEHITTCKKRTCMQPQFNKANKVNAECKDHLMSTLSLEFSDILTIQKKKATDEQNLPTNQHPFDHFLVICVYQRR